MTFLTESKREEFWQFRLKYDESIKHNIWCHNTQYNGTEHKTLGFKTLIKMRLCQPPDGNTSHKYKLLCFKTTKKICKEKNALAFNRDRCCNLELCLQLIPFHYLNFLKCAVPLHGMNTATSRVENSAQV